MELAKITGLKLFHNHMTIDIVSDLFENMPQERSRLTGLFREEIFKAYLKSDEYGMIFTFMWAIDDENDRIYIDHVEEIFRNQNGDVYFVELEADYDIRIERNKTENRLLNKPTKRNIEKSEALFIRLEEKYKLNSYIGEIQKENYIKINNTNLSPKQTAEIIKNKFEI